MRGSVTAGARSVPTLLLRTARLRGADGVPVTAVRSVAEELGSTRERLVSRKASAPIAPGCCRGSSDLVIRHIALPARAGPEAALINLTPVFHSTNFYCPIFFWGWSGGAGFSACAGSPS